MSPPRDPESRPLRRYGRDVAEAERRRDAPSSPSPKRRVDDRRGAQSPDLGGLTDEQLERIPLREKHGRRRPLAASRRSTPAEDPDDSPAPSTDASAGRFLGQVVALSRGPCEVELGDGRRVVAELPKALARESRSLLAVGDRVELDSRAGGELFVARRLPRTSRLSRPDPFQPHEERVLVANLDLGVVVASLRHPPLSTGLVDRFLVALEHGGVASALAVNKVDLADGGRPTEDDLAALAPYRQLGLPVVFCSARSGQGLTTLRGWMAGRTVAFVGHSGVGKSSLLNALVPGADAATGAVAKRRGRGRHTTSQARVYPLEDGGRLVDTPGVREFGLRRLTPRELAVYFDEFSPQAAGCRFADCSHVHEPACAVRAAAERGQISPQRYAAYLRILESFERE